MSDMSISSLSGYITDRMDWNRQHIVAEIVAQFEQTRELLKALLMPSPPAELQSVAPSILPEIGKEYHFWIKDSTVNECFLGTVTHLDYPWVRILPRDGGYAQNFTMEMIGSFNEARPRI